MFASCLMGLAVIAGTEDGGADPDHGTSTGNCVLVISGHTHRQYIHGYIIVFFSHYVNRKVMNFFKKFTIISRIFANWGDRHESIHSNVWINTNFFQKRQDISDLKTGLTLLQADINFQ